MMFYAHKEALVIDDTGLATGDTPRIMVFLEKAWKACFPINTANLPTMLRRYELLRRYIGKI